MILKLAALPQLQGPQGDDYNGKVPKRALFAAPDVAIALLALEKATGGLIYTDVYRSGDAQLAALKTKRGVQRPGFSGHGYGLSIDLDIDEILSKQTWSYGFLNSYMASMGWHCHRRDGHRGMEDWHFNYLGLQGDKYLSATTSDHYTWGRPIEMRIEERYNDDFFLTPTQVQEKLTLLGFYKGEVDGKIGPLSKVAITAFQRAWELDADGIPGENTQRTLAYVSAEIVIEKVCV